MLLVDERPYKIGQKRKACLSVRKLAQKPAGGSVLCVGLFCGLWNEFPVDGILNENTTQLLKSSASQNIN